ncbi:MAG: hypothetical protein HY286_16210 [Planctomycetes bacterium]|nr:hypothetical protein [Planctomycetota bacterium]
MMRRFQLPVCIVGVVFIELFASARASAQKPPDPELQLELPDVRDPARPPKIALFRSPGFPTVDAPEIDASVLDKALAGLPVDILASADDIKNKLKIRDYDVLILPYGSAFPSGPWTHLRSFVEHGGGLVVLGGAPFHQPVRYEAKKDTESKLAAGLWIPGTRQPTFAHELLIGPAEKINITNEKQQILPDAGWSGPVLQKITATYALTLRFTTKKDFDKEDGTSGPRDAIARPVVHMVREQDGIPVGCPLIEIDRIRGSEAGARWVFVTSDAVLDAETIRRCATRALEGACELEARPAAACIEPGATAVIRVLYRKPFVRKGAVSLQSVQLNAFGPNGTRAWTGVAQVTLNGAAEFRVGEGEFLNIQKPGLYTVEVGATGVDGESYRMTTGFWVRDAKLLNSGPKMSVSADWLHKDNKVFPVIGTTYMASDVHRKFLFEPNPYLWDRDFATMRANGVNFVRTGLWTGWQRTMLDSGAIDDSILRALEAYVLSAAKNGIVVCFNFFAFQPPAFGGSNPFLDPRALEGQKALLGLIAGRFRDCNWIHYDLINEPSYCPPENLWSNRPIGDDFEKKEWAKWVANRHGEDLVAIRDRWREPWGEVLAMPKLDDLNYSGIRETRRPRKAADFHKFSNDMVAGWAAEMRAAIRAAGGDTLVTLGQDEGGAWLRPSQQLYASAVDYTAIHSWWNNDDLLWDCIITKTPEKPNLIQETGLMRLEDIDGFPWRSPEDAAKLLERKFAFAFAARGAGGVEWAWNINPYMPIDNESVIGIWRPDGTAKPELFVLKRFGVFFSKIAEYLDDFAPEEVCVVIPHTRMFAGRQKGVDAVKEIVRSLTENFGIVPNVISELRLTSERLVPAKLVIVPCAEMLEDQAAVVLQAAARDSKKILFTGWMEGNPYGRVTSPFAALGVCDAGRPVALHEHNNYREFTNDAFITFDDNRGQWLRAGAGRDPLDFKQSVWHEPLPLEFAREPQALRGLLSIALKNAGVESRRTASPLTLQILKMPRASLVIAVNETPGDLERSAIVGGAELKFSVRAGRSKFILVDPRSGVVIAESEK